MTLPYTGNAPGSNADQGVGRSVIADAECWVKTRWGSRQVEITVIDLRRDLAASYLRMGYRLTRETFPYGDEHFGISKRSCLALAVMRKTWECCDPSMFRVAPHLRRFVGVDNRAGRYFCMRRLICASFPFISPYGNIFTGCPRY